jgi:cell division protein FtsB
VTEEPTTPPRVETRYRHLGFIAALAGVVLVFAGFTVFGTNGVVRLAKLRDGEEVLTDRAFALLQENENLRQRILRLQRDDHFLEAVARSRLGLVRDGEIVYRFVPPDAQAPEKRARIPSQSVEKQAP